MNILGYRIDYCSIGADMETISIVLPPEGHLYFGPWEPFAFAAEIHGRENLVLYRRAFIADPAVLRNRLAELYERAEQLAVPRG